MSNRKVNLSLSELEHLIRISKQDEKTPTYPYVNYAPFPVSVLSKEFAPNGKAGHIREDITELEIEIAKKADFIKMGYLGENVDEPKDGSYSDKGLISIAELEFEEFCEKVDKIFGIITLNRLSLFLSKTEKPAKFERYCQARINELEKMENSQSDYKDLAKAVDV